MACSWVSGLLPGYGMNPSLGPPLETSCFKGSWKRAPYSRAVRSVLQLQNSKPIIPPNPIPASTLLVTLFKIELNNPLNTKGNISTHNRLVEGSSPSGPTIFGISVKIPNSCSDPKSSLFYDRHLPRYSKPPLRSWINDETYFKTKIEPEIGKLPADAVFGGLCGDVLPPATAGFPPDSFQHRIHDPVLHLFTTHFVDLPDG